MFSEILLPFTNLDWLGEIKDGRLGPSLLLSSLENNPAGKVPHTYRSKLSQHTGIVHFRKQYNARTREVFMNNLAT